MIKVYVRGKGEVTLDKNNYKADGGEGTIYIKSPTVFKIYHNPSKMIPEAKIAELSALDKDNILKPKDILLDGAKNNQIIGFTMDEIKDADSLCVIFNTIYLNDNNISPDTLVKLTENLFGGVQFIHDKNCLVVDGNEMNFLLNTKNYTTPYFIDVNAYQTKSFPAGAFTPMFFDPLGDIKKPTKLNDWYWCGILATKIFVGVHPFKGTHPKYGKKNADVLQRMKDHVSIFNKESTCAGRDFSYIPSAYMNWLTDLFEKGKRTPPPTVAGLLNVVQVTTETITSVGSLTIKRLKKLDDTIIKHKYFNSRHITICTKCFYIDDKKYTTKLKKYDVIFSPKTMTPIVIGIQDDKLCAFKLSGEKLNICINATNFFVVNNNYIYVSYSGTLNELVIDEFGGVPIIAPTQNHMNLMPHSSAVYDGIIYQNIMNKAWVLIPYQLNGKGYCISKAIPELDGYKIIHAKHDSGVCMIIGFKENKYHRFIFRFNNLYDKYDIRIIEDIQYPHINFVTLENGVVVSLDENNCFEIFFNKIGDNKIKVVDDKNVKIKMILSKYDLGALFYKGDSLYSIKMA